MVQSGGDRSLGLLPDAQHVQLVLTGNNSASQDENLEPLLRVSCINVTMPSRHIT